MEISLSILLSMSVDMVVARGAAPAMYFGSGSVLAQCLVWRDWEERVRLYSDNSALSEIEEVGGWGGRFFKEQQDCCFNPSLPPLPPTSS